MVYKCIGSVILDSGTFKNENNYLYSFDDSYDEVIFETPSKIEGISRGWVGDIYYYANQPFYEKTMESSNKISIQCVKDVLLIRVNAKCESGTPVIWSYTFLKH